MGAEDVPPIAGKIPDCFVDRSKRKRAHEDDEQDIPMEELEAATLSCPPVSAKKGARKKAILETKAAGKRQKPTSLTCTLGRISICNVQCRPESYITTKFGNDKPKLVIALNEKQTPHFVSIIEQTATAMATQDLTKDEAKTFARSLVEHNSM